MAIKHIVPPTFFNQALNLFSAEYDWYIAVEKFIDDMGKPKIKYEKRTIKGSLQPKASAINFEKTGNTVKQSYDFYCSAIYRINIGDIICYYGNWLQVNEMQPYDEWGVRHCGLDMININAYRDLEEYAKFINGEETI